MIKKIPKDVPASTGIYFFLGPNKKRLYIGKAANLRNRLRSYLEVKQLNNARIAKMLEYATKLDWQETGSEIEALILESQLIKKHKPPYNISMRDDKNYAYVVFTKDEFPKIFISHRDGIGPFTSSSELRAALKTLRKFFPYCTCKQQHNRPCLNAHIGKCFGICCLKNPKSEILNSKKITKAYKKNIKIIRDILSGKRKTFMKRFPNIFANALVIHEIADREDALGELQAILNLAVFPSRIEAYDISNIQGLYATGSMAVFENGVPDKSEYRKFKIRTTHSPDDTAMLKELLTRRFRHREWPMPNLVLIDGGKGQLNVAKKLFTPALSIAKGKQEIFSTTLAKPLTMAKLPAKVQRLITHMDSEAHRFAIGYYRRLHEIGLSDTI